MEEALMAPIIQKQFPQLPPNQERARRRRRYRRGR